MCDGNGVMTPGEDDTNILDNGTCNTYTCINGTLQSTSNKTAGMSCIMKGGTNGYCQQNPDPDNPGIFVCVECNVLTQMPCTGVPTAPICWSGKCVPNTCANASNCGGSCLACGVGKTCSVGGVGGDCFSLNCSGTPKTCQTPTCNDGFKNGRETDVDCGGTMCPLCPTGYMCLLPTDCQSGVCGPSSQPGQQATCQAPTCTDGVMNGGETGVDCGGFDGDAGCPPCADGG
jgi:hypothetical protein